MQIPDYIVLVAYFFVMTAIGVLSMLAVKKQEDFFLGSRGFGKVFQAFAAFGAGTGSHDPVTVGRTTFTSGLSGIWSVLLWLFVTPFYWFTAVWYRRMRHITMGDWFVERYQSKALGIAFMLFAIAFYAVYLALGFSAISKVGTPLLADAAFVHGDQVQAFGFSAPLEHALVYVCALIVLVYGVLGGLRAAYWTDVIQGVFIILLSVLLIPMGLRALADKEAELTNVDPQTISTLDGFRIMHEYVPDEYFEITNSPRGGEFPIYYIVAITLLNLVAIVVHPHMAVTGGGSAKSENAARIGLVVGNFLKRFCTIGWAITILIILAYMADSVEIAEDPDQVWGIAAREILSPYPGLAGLMLACLMAALMSSASAYMLVVSALVIRNFYVYIDRDASETTCVLLGRVVSALVLVGGVVVSLAYMDIFEQLKVAWEMPILFAAIFWIGMFWRRATKWAAWGTVLATLAAFFLVPWLLPKYMPSLAENPKYAVTNDIVTTTVTREAVHADVGRSKAARGLWEKRATLWLQQRDAAKLLGPRPDSITLEQSIPDPVAPDGELKASKSHVAFNRAAITLWDQQFDAWRDTQGETQTLTDQTRRDAAEALGPCPALLELGETTQQKFVTGGKAIFWTGGVEPIGQKKFKAIDNAEADSQGENITVVREQYDCPLRGQGRFRVDFLIYDALGIDLAKMPNAALETLRLPTRVVLPFVVMILLSLITPRVKKEPLDRFYVKMKTPVDPEPELDARELAASYADPTRFDHKRLISRFGLEFQRPGMRDIVGFVVCFVICFGLIGLTVLLANLQF